MRDHASNTNLFGLGLIAATIAICVLFDLPVSTTPLLTLIFGGLLIIGFLLTIVKN